MSKFHSNKDNLQVVYEDNHLIIINKRPGDIVQGDKTGDEPLSEIVKDYIKHKYRKPGNVYLGVVHRLDRPTSGIVVFAKTSKALSRMNKLFASKQITKIYWAIVKNKPTQSNSTLVSWLKKNTKNNKSFAYNSEVKDSKKAILHFKTLKSLDKYYLLEISLETGRHHQIRTQLAHIGSPIKGDLKYGFDRSNKDASIHLHARKIEFTHPVKNTDICVVARTPDDALWNACEE